MKPWNEEQHERAARVFDNPNLPAATRTLGLLALERVAHYESRVEELDQKVLDVILEATNTPITKEINEALDRAADLVTVLAADLSRVLDQAKIDPEHYLVLQSALDLLGPSVRKLKEQP